MKKLIILSFILAYGCGNIQTNSTSVESESINSDHARSSNCTTQLINNEIVKNIFNQNVFRSDTLTLQRIFKVKPQIKTSKISGSYDNSLYDSYTFKTPNAEVKFFRNAEGFYLEDSYIGGNEVNLIKNCSIGMKKADFFSQLSIAPVQCDTLIVMDSEQTTHLQFVFRENILKELKINIIK